MAPSLVHAYRGAAALTSTLPAWMARPTARLVGLAVSLPDSHRRLLVRRNLLRVDPTLRGLELRRRIGEVFEHYSGYWYETLRLPSVSASQLDANMTHDGFDKLQASIRRGKGTILVLPHLGYWEWAAFWLTKVHGFGVTAVVERLEPPEIYEWFLSMRTSLGIHIIPSGPHAGREVVAALKRNDVVCLLSDRDIEGNGIEVDFFGERTTLPAGPAMLGLRYDADLLPCAIYLKDGKHFGVVRDPLDVSRRGSLREDLARVTQDVAHCLEDLIRPAPTQWHLMSPNWPSDYVALGMTAPTTPTSQRRSAGRASEPGQPGQ